MISLLLETCTKRAIVAIVQDSHLLFCAALPFGYSHSRYLLTKIDEGLNSLKLKPKDLDRIVTGTGPGSYTGIRVGAAVAKTMSYANKTPLIGVCTLTAFVPQDDGPYAALIDAKMGGAYLMTGEKSGGRIANLSDPQVCPLEEINDRLHQVKILVTPDASRLEKAMRELFPDNQWMWEETTPDPVFMEKIADEKHENGEFTTDGSLQLLYLR